MKRFLAILVTIVLLITCTAAFADSPETEAGLQLAEAAIHAMTSTVGSLTETVAMLSTMLQENTMLATRFADNTLANFAKQMENLYAKSQYDEYIREHIDETDEIKELLNDIFEQLYESPEEYDSIKDFYNTIIGSALDEDGNFVHADFNKTLTEILSQIDNDGIDKDKKNKTDETDINSILNDLMKQISDKEAGLHRPPDKKEQLTGGWTITDDYEIKDFMHHMVATATADFSDVAIKPIACIGTQLVSGTNYCFFCCVNHMGEPEDNYTQYILLYVYADLNGNVETVGWAPIDPSILSMVN